jgi:Mn-dependent DtxR family transcriptional regulator
MEEKSAIPDDLRRFIWHSIPSVPYLEALLLLRERAAHAWSGAELAQRLYMDERGARQLLEKLRAAGIAQPEGKTHYRYAPKTAQLAELLDRLARVYAAHLVDVSTLIHLRPNKKAQLFADAFVWRKEP